VQGRALLLIGVVLTISNASGSTGASVSLAEETPSAREDVPGTAVNLVALLPIPDTEHEARRTSRLLPKYTTWRAITVPERAAPVAAPVPAPVPVPAPKRIFLAVVDQPDIQERHKIIADEVLRLLPVHCQKQLQNFYVRYEKPERRGLAGKSTIILDGTLPDDEFRAVLIHEALGHVFDLGCLAGSPTSGASVFKDGNETIFRDDPSLAFYRISWTNSTTRRNGMTDTDFVSGYASSDPFEDLAESAIYYLLHHQTFTERARQNSVLAMKLKWLQTFLPVQPVHSVTADTWNGQLPWDATKLAYTWQNPSMVAGQ